ncbi:MAG: tetratricopeptide repeat protein, partial [Chloroflexota bacterium]
IYPTNEVTTMVMQDLEHLSEIELTPIEQPEPELTYIFKHIVTQEVAYESLPFSTRSRLHGQIGTFIEFKYSEDIDKNLDLLAFHFNLSRNEAKKRHYLQRAGDAAKANYANHAAISYYTDLIPLLSDQEKVSVLDDLGAVKELIGAWDEAGELYRESISLAESLDLKAELSKVQAALGELRRKRGDFPESQQWLESSLEISQSIDDLVGIGQVYITMGTLNAQQGDLDKALDLYSQSLEIRRLLNDDHNIGKVLNNMAVVAEYQGNIDECRAYLEESLIHRRRSGERLEIGRVLGNLGYVELEQGNFDKASEMLQEALVIFREIGDKWSIANTLNNLGRVHTTIGEFRNASTVYLESLSINSDLGDKWALAFLLEDIAGMLAQRSRSPVAIHLAGAADSLRKEIESPLSDSMRERLTVALQPSEEALGEGAPEAWAYGRGLGLDSAVDFASNALA